MLILEEGNFPHQRFSWCDILVPRRALKWRHPGTAWEFIEELDTFSKKNKVYILMKISKVQKLLSIRTGLDLNKLSYK